MRPPRTAFASPTRPIRHWPATRSWSNSTVTAPTAPPHTARPEAEGRVVVQNLTKVFRGRIRAVDSLSFTVEPGSVTGFLGPNGAGKTTTLRMVLGLVRPTSGSATIGGLTYRSLPHPI